MSQEKPLVSVIISTHNVAQFIEKCLKSLKQQTYPNVEILVVDKYSNDGTRGIAEKMGVRVLDAPIERSTQMNFGAENARGEFLYFTGADMEHDPDFIEKAVAKCLNEGFDAIITSVKTRSDNFWGKCKGLERLAYLGDDLVETARFIRRDVFFALGGWDESLVAAEDYDLQYRLNKAGYKTGRIESYEYHLGEYTSLPMIWRRNFYYGRTFINYLAKRPTYGTKQIFPIRPAFIRRFDVFLKDPIHFVGFIIIKVVQYTAGFLGLLTGALDRLGGKKVVG
jgi:glycosyltransferase involved in cell wall biosynthesis